MSVVGDAQRYRDAADGLKGSLRQSFSHAHMAIEFEPEIDENTRDASAGVITDASAQRGIVAASRQVEAGEDRGVSVAALGSTKVAAEQQRKKAEKAAEDTRFIMLLDQARAYSARLGAEIADWEGKFEAEMGDAWREQIANEIMDPDEIPQRREGESMDDYRERLEEALVAKMIDPATGEVRSEYADSRYAQWAKAKHHKREADAYIERRSDPTLSEEDRNEMDKEFASSSTYNEIRQADDGLIASGENAVTLASATDELREEEAAMTSTAAAEAAAFPGLG